MHKPEDKRFGSEEHQGNLTSDIANSCASDESDVSFADVLLIAAYNTAYSQSIWQLQSLTSRTNK